MLLESALAELSIGVDDEPEDNADGRNDTAVVLRMGSPDGPKPNQKQEELGQNKAGEQRHWSSLQNSFRAPGKVPFVWEIEPGVRRPELESPRRPCSPPLRLPPSAHSAALSSPSPRRSRRRRTAGYFPWNSPRGDRGSSHRHALSEGQFQFGSIILRDDTSSNSEFDSSEDPSPVSTLDRYGSPARSLSSLDDRSPTLQFQLSPLPNNVSPVVIDTGNLSAFMVRQSRELMGSNRARSCDGGLFSCASKCFFFPYLKRKEKTRQSGWSNGGSQKKSLAAGTSNSDENVLLGARKGFRMPSAMKKHGENSTVAAMKQVRFSEEDAAKHSPPFNNPATVAASEFEWASYGLF